MTMEVQTLSCNNCGAPIDVPPQANFATCAHCGSRLAVRRTDSVAYTEVLGRIDKTTSHMSEDLQTLRQESELERIDREWQIEREQFMQRGRDGSSSVPSNSGTVVAVIGAVGAIVFALFWIAMASSIVGFGFATGFGGGPFNLAACFPLFGVFLIIMI